MSKIYTDDMKYGDGQDNFNLKLVIFYDICARVDLPNTVYKRALPIMLKGRASEYYYTGLIQNNLDFDQLCTAIEQHFEDANHRRNTLTAWNNINLLSIKSKNPDKSTGECFDLLLSKLRTLRYGLSQELQSDAFMLNKLVLACRKLPDCQIACSAPADTLNSMINTLKSSIEAYEFSHSQADTSHTYMTDRRFRSNGDNNRYPRLNRPPSRENQSRFNRKRRCFVCDKEDCWSTNHTESERQEAKDRFKEKYKSRFNNNFGKRFQKSFRQYVMEYEGVDDNIDDTEDINETFQSIILEEDTVKENAASFDDIENESEIFLTSAGQISLAHAKDITDTLNKSAFEHSLYIQSGTSPPENPPENPLKNPPMQDCSLTTYEQKRYGPSQFYGIMIDTGASTRSTAGYDQYLAYTTVANVPIDTSSKGEVKIKFGIGSTSSIGSVYVDSPIGTVEFHIVQADTPFLLSLADMDRLQVQLNNLKNVLVTTQGDIPVVRQFGHLFLLWNESLHAFVQESLYTPTCFLTELELRRLHKRFGHPSVHRLQRVLEQSGHEVDRDILQYLTKYCASCQKHGASPGRFKFTLRDDVEFNYCVYVDIMYINNQPLLHIVDEGTRFQAGRWLMNISAKHTWDKLRECWIDTYLGPPDYIAHDAGKNFVSKEFQQYARTLGTVTKSVPVEAHQSIGIVERYHRPVRRAYQIVSEELPDLGREAALQMAFKAINDTAGPDGIVPTLLVFGAYPRLVESDAPSQTVSHRATVLKKAMEEVRKLRAKRQVNDALNQRNGPSTLAIKDLPLNSDVLVWRETPGNKTGQWTGPFTLLGTDKEDCIVALPSGPTTFRSTVVKPYFTDETGQDRSARGSARGSAARPVGT